MASQSIREIHDSAAGAVAAATAAADASAEAFKVWSAFGPNKRRQVLQAAAGLLRARAEELMTVMMEETHTGKPWAEFNVNGAVAALNEAASLTTQITGELLPSEKPGALAMAVRQPVGVVLGIAPWNAPLILGVRAFAMPLACGNSAILKASELCPRSHLLLGKLMSEAGLPDGALNVVTHAPEDAARVVEALIAHPAVRRVNFTGSTRTGRLIAEMAGRHLKPALLELGGKAPLVVLADADLDEAVNAAAFGAFLNQGQICMSTERIVVDEAVADAFAEKFAAKATALGDLSRSALGSMISEDAASKVEALIDDAVKKGAKRLTLAGGKRRAMHPVVLDYVTPDMLIYHEESFGPVAPIVRVNGVEEAIRVANDTEYGLAAAVFGRDIATTLEVARRIEAGVCHINGPTVQSEPQMPFGGMKASGYGRFGGKASIAEFTELRWISIATRAQAYPF